MDTVDPSLFNKAVAGQRPLRVGLLVDSATTVPRVFRAVVEQIQESNFARVELIVLNTSAETETPSPPTPLTRIKRLLSSSTYRSDTVWGLYCRWDRRNASEHDPNECVPATDLFDGIPMLSVTPITKRFVHRFPPDAIERIQNYDIDVFFRFGFNILRGDILRAAKHGIWSFHHGDNEFYRGGPAHFWELVEGNPVSGVILQVLTEELDAGHVLAKGIFATSEDGFSMTRNQMRPYWGSVTFAIQKLRELYDHGPEYLSRRSVPNAPYRGAKKIYTRPTAGELIGWLGPLIVKRGMRMVKRKLTTGALVDHWRLALRVSGQPIATSEKPDLTGFHHVTSPKGRFYADPFLVSRNGQPWVFFEDYEYAAWRGRISAASVHGVELGEAIPVLEPGYHLSYPCLFEDQGELFMIPESMSNRSVDLYRCDRFPDRWTHVRRLFDGHAVDTTVFRHNDRYWFFTTLVDPIGDGTQLWLFHAPRIDGEWTPHPANPLSTDVRHCRSAGAIVKHGGSLFRPSQDCSIHYGRSFRLNKIMALDTGRYEERPCEAAEPSGNAAWMGTHTLAWMGDLEVIDTCTRLRVRDIFC